MRKVTITLPDGIGTLTLDAIGRWVPDNDGEDAKAMALYATSLTRDMWSPSYGPGGYAQALAVTKKIPGSVAHVPPFRMEPGSIY